MASSAKSRRSCRSSRVNGIGRRVTKVKEKMQTGCIRKEVGRSSRHQKTRDATWKFFARRLPPSKRAHERPGIYIATDPHQCRVVILHRAVPAVAALHGGRFGRARCGGRARRERNSVLDDTRDRHFATCTGVYRTGLTVFPHLVRAAAGRLTASILAHFNIRLRLRRKS